MQTNENLFQEFPPVSIEEWKQKIIKDLKGKPYESLLWEAEEGIILEPFYKRENTPSISFLNYVSDLQRANTNNAWYNCGVVEVENTEQANQKALKLLQSGVNSLQFTIEKQTDFQSLLKDIQTDYIQTIVKTSSLEVARDFLTYISKNTLQKHDLALDADLASDYAAGKVTENELGQWLDFIAETSPSWTDFPVKLFSIRSEEAHYAGATTVDELAYLLAKTNFLFSELEKRGLSPETIAKSLFFKIPVGISFFKEIGKIESLKILYFNFLKQKNIDWASSFPIIHCETSTFYHSRLDMHNNMLRNTTQTVSAVLAGANTIHTTPHDKVLGKTTGFSERIAKNVQILLQEEGYFQKVKNIVEGNYYLKNITAKLCETTWEKYHDIIEDNKDWKALLKQGYWQKSFEAGFEKLVQAYLKQEKVMVGVNKYPNPQEKEQETFVQSQEARHSDFRPLTLKRIASYIAIQNHEN